MKTILLTGGAGYIGSHIAVCAHIAGLNIVLIDNYSNSSQQTIENIGKIISGKPICIEGDIRDTSLVEKVIHNHNISDVIHLAGLKSVEESVSKKQLYYDNNVEGTNSLLRAMENSGIYNIVFSSSATVYGEPEYLPLDESHRIQSVNPYAETKILVEQILQDKCHSDERWKAVSLRYFNPVGCHDSGLIGDNPKALRANLMPMIARVATGQSGKLEIFGNDYNTPDGTCLRDYIHIMDLVKGHLSALEFLENNRGHNVFNLGTGRGISVLDLIAMFKKVSGKDIPYRITSRRKGDVEACYANCNKASESLNWHAEKSLEDMCDSIWNWCQENQE